MKEMEEFKKFLKMVGFESYMEDINDSFIYMFNDSRIEVYYDNNGYRIMYIDNTLLVWKDIGNITTAIKFLKFKFIHIMRKRKIALLDI